MASRSSSVRGGLNWRAWAEILRRGVALGDGRDETQRGRRARCRVGVEALEGRQLLSVSLVSSAPAGQALGAIEDRLHSAVSDNGQFVVFVSTTPAANFGAGTASIVDDAASRDVFLKNLSTGAVTIVSATGGTARGGEYPAISADGRYVAFTSDFGGYASGGVTDANGQNDVYVFDTQTSAYTPVSVNAAGTGMVGNAIEASISNNGRVVAYTTTNVGTIAVAAVTDTNGARDVFVRNLDTNTTTAISVNTTGTSTGNARAEQPAVSGDGLVVAFMSEATDLTAVSDPSAGTDDIFRRVVAGTATDLISVGSVGGNPQAVGGTAPTISSDGNLVAFASSSADVVAGDTNGATDVFVRNLQQGATQLVSSTQAGAIGEGNSINPSLSDDGNFVAFQTAAANLVPGTNAAGNDIVLKNRTDGSIVRVSQTDAGAPASAGGVGVNSSFPEVNANGTAVAFFSLGTNLVPTTEADAETDADLFAWTSGAPQPGDTANPVAVITAPANVTAGGGTSHTVTVTYTDDVAVDGSTIGIDDITVTGTGGPLTVTNATASPAGNAASVVVTYTLTPPGGTWDAADDGSYTVTVVADSVRDTSAKGVATATSTFTVNVSGGTTGGADLVAAIATTPRPLPTAVVTGQRGNVRVLVTNQGDAPVAAPRTSPVAVRLLASADAVLDGSDVEIASVARPMRLLPGRSRPMPMRFVYPTTLADGPYYLLTQVDATNVVTEGNEGNNVGATAAPITIAAPFVDLVPTVVGAPVPGGVLGIGRRANVPVTVANNGNVAASGLLQVDLFASADAVADASDLPLASVTRRVKLKNGKSRPIRVAFLVPANLPAGSYFITATIDQPNAIPESNDANNTAVGAAPVTAA